MFEWVPICPMCHTGIYSTSRHRTPGVRPAPGDQCARFNSGSDSVAVLIAHSNAEKKRMTTTNEGEV